MEIVSTEATGRQLEPVNQRSRTRMLIWKDSDEEIARRKMGCSDRIRVEVDAPLAMNGQEF